MDTLTVENINTKPILDFGENLGAFDDNGITPCCILNCNHRKLMYYCGWNVHVKIPFTCAIGLAESFDNGKTFKKLYKGAIIDRDKDDYQFVAVNDVIFDHGIFKTWYLSCIKWEIIDGKPNHFYNIRYAESKDGVNWLRNPQPVIDFKNEYEYAISTPRVIKDGEYDYKMWYSYRAQRNIDTYRIGYAESRDGIHWKRKDEEMMSLDVGKLSYDWDHEMICYPFVFDHDNHRYMLYNGNKYGKTGFGIAVLNR